MRAVLEWLVGVIGSRWVSSKAEIVCGTYAFKVACLLAVLLWRCHGDLAEALVRLLHSHGTDRQAWGALLCVTMGLGTLGFFLWMRRIYKARRKEAEWHTPIFRLVR